MLLPLEHSAMFEWPPVGQQKANRGFAFKSGHWNSHSQVAICWWCPLKLPLLEVPKRAICFVGGAVCCILFGGGVLIRELPSLANHTAMAKQFSSF